MEKRKANQRTKTVLSLVLFSIILLSLISPIQALTSYWYNSCELTSDWDSSGNPPGYYTFAVNTNHVEGNYSLEFTADSSSPSGAWTNERILVTNFSDLPIYAYYFTFRCYVSQLSGSADHQLGSGKWEGYYMQLNIENVAVGVGIIKNGSGFNFCIDQGWDTSTPTIIATSTTLRSLSIWYLVDVYIHPTYGSTLYVNGTLDFYENRSLSNVKPTYIWQRNWVYQPFGTGSGVNSWLIDYIELSDTKGGTGTTPPYVPPVIPPTTGNFSLTQMPQKLGTVLGIDLWTGGLLLSLFTCLLFLLPVIVYSKNIYAILIVGIGSLALSSALGWLDPWVLLIIVMMEALFFASKMRDFITGG